MSMNNKFRYLLLTMAVTPLNRQWPSLWASMSLQAPYTLITLLYLDIKLKSKSPLI